MVFELREFIFVIVTLASIIGTFEVMRSRVKKVEDSNDRVTKTLFLITGGLNVVDNNTCKDRRQTLDTKIYQESKITARALDSIENLNQNIIKIMIHMKIEPIQKKSNGGDC